MAPNAEPADAFVMLEPGGVTLRTERRPGQFSVPLVFTRAAATFRAAPGLILGLALLVFIPISVLDAAVSTFSEHLVANDPFDATVVTVAHLLDLVADLLGFALFGGLLDHLVGRIHHGHEAHRPRQVVRSISYGRLLAASMLFNLAVVSGVALCIIPGFFAFTLFAFVAPLINIERIGVIQAFRRSYQLSRHFLVGVACAVTIPFIIESYIDDVVGGLSIAHQFWGEVATSLVLSLTLTSAVVLFEVCTAYQLLEIESERKGTPGPNHH